MRSSTELLESVMSRGVFEGACIDDLLREGPHVDCNTTQEGMTKKISIEAKVGAKVLQLQMSLTADLQEGSGFVRKMV